jgi:hypothetical protein
MIRRDFVKLIGCAAPVAAAARPILPSLMAPAPGLFSVKDFGATGRAGTDDSLAVQSAYDAVRDAGGGTLFFPPGQYSVELRMSSRNVHLAGAGRGASILQPVHPDGTVLNARYRTGSWELVTISNLSLRGVGRRSGRGFATGDQTHERNDEYSGSTAFTSMDFSNFDKCIARPFGAIGLWIDRCQFSAARFHVWGRGVNSSARNDAMHNGCLFLTNSHLDSFDTAMIYIDSPTGDSGQVVIDNNIIENGAGFVIYVKQFNASGGVPGIVMRSNWNENTATGRDIDIEGEHHDRAQFIEARNATAEIRIEDTPLGDIKLVNSSIKTVGCNLQNLKNIEMDSASTIIHDTARLFSGTTVGRVESIARPTNIVGLNTPWFRMVEKRGKSPLGGAKILLAADGTKPFPLIDSIRNVMSQSILADADHLAQAIDIRPGQSVRMFFATSSHVQWAVTIINYRVIGAGLSIVTVAITGDAGISGQGRLDSLTWESVVNISRIDKAGIRIAPYFSATTQTTLQIANIAIVAFETMQEALVFANQDSMPATRNGISAEL